MKVIKILTTSNRKSHLMQQQLLLQAQNRKTSVWTREKINQLIELYKQHECLWNPWHEAYKNKDKRNRAIEEICRTLGVRKFEFGKKVHNLRNQFNTEMKKLEQRIEEAGVNMDDANDTELRCKWSHFESLMFLRDIIAPRPGGCQTSFPPLKKMRLKFEINNSEDNNQNVSTALTSSSGNTSKKNTNVEDSSQLQYEENETEELITDDFQSFENESEEVIEPDCNEEIRDKKYNPPQQELPSSNLTNSAKNKKQKGININEGSFIADLDSNNATVVASNSQISSAPSTTTPIISSITSTNSLNRSLSVLRDQWDAFGELVADEIRNLNSEISRKRLKRKIMQAMLEVGEDDDNLTLDHSRRS